MYAPLISIILKKVCEWRVLIHAYITVTVSTYNDLYNWGINYVNHSKVLQCVLRQKFSYSTNMKQTQ